MVLTITVGGMSNDLKFYDRQKLEYWLRTKQSLRAIARIMRRDHSVLVRELKRNGSGNRKKYRADVAERLSEKKRFKQHKGKLDKYPELKTYVIEGLQKEWSPDVIAGKLKTAALEQTIRHESIYHSIYNKDGRFEGWHYINERQRYGDWESNSVIFSKQKTILSVQSERKSKLIFDNGTEGVHHTELKKEYDVETYFCDPFASWQKGGNEVIHQVVH